MTCCNSVFLVLVGIVLFTIPTCCSRVLISVNAGVASYSICKTKTSKPIKVKKITTGDFSKMLADFQLRMDVAWQVQLEKNVDFVTVMDAALDGTSAGFGVGPSTARDMRPCQDKISTQIAIWRNTAADVFKRSDGFSVSESGTVQIGTENYPFDGLEGYYAQITFPSVVLTNSRYPDFRMEVLNGVAYNSLDLHIPLSKFSSSDVLEDTIRDIVRPNNVYAIEQWDRVASEPDSVTKVSSSKKRGMLLGAGVTYNEFFFPKVSSRYGLYIGVEAFFETNPTSCKSNGFDVTEKTIGIRPQVGVVSKDKWAIYGILGINRSYEKFKAVSVRKKKSAVGFEYGIGTEYLLSNKFSIGAKVIRSQYKHIKIQDGTLRARSTKVILSLNYCIN